MDADTFATTIGGTWLRKPARTWQYRGICWHDGPPVPGRLLLAQDAGFRYGLDLSKVRIHRNCAGVVLAGEPPRHIGAPVLRVDSIRLAVRRLAANRRAGTRTTIFALTGSVGKTSSCYLLGHLLGQIGRVIANGQFNYPDGIASEACNLGEAEYAVIEASLQGLGEATAMLQPHVAVLTNLSPVHIELTGGMLGLAERKASLFGHLAKGGVAVINRDIPYFDQVLEIARKTAGTVLTFGKDPGSGFRLLDYDLSGRRVRACILGENVEYELGLRGQHMALNSLGVLAAAHAAGIAWKPLLPFCASASMVAGRGSVKQLAVAGHRVSIMDDSYNASPAAMQAAFAMLATTAPSSNGRRIAVLADMLELGDAAVDYHRQLCRSLVDSGVDRVYLAGTLMRHLWDVLPPTLRAQFRTKVGDLLRPLVRDMRDGDVLLLKGSHGTGMYGLVDDLHRMSLVPRLAGAGSASFMILRFLAHGIQPATPLRIQRWTSWQLRKLTERNTHGPT